MKVSVDVADFQPMSTQPSLAVRAPALPVAGVIGVHTIRVKEKILPNA